jgi:hypothetical protein
MAFKVFIQMNFLKFTIPLPERFFAIEINRGRRFWTGRKAVLLFCREATAPHPHGNWRHCTHEPAGMAPAQARETLVSR